VYFDTSCIAKFYFNEPESSRVRELVRKADAIHSSIWALAEFHAVVHRRLREGSSTAGDARDLASRFADHVEQGLWNLIPVNEALLRRTSALMVAAPGDPHRRCGAPCDGARDRRARYVDK
jgi:predicted nucleic acid-binding protein